MMRMCIVAAGLLLLAAPLAAETYSWVDESGTYNFTEDYSRVPKKYRGKVDKRGNMNGKPIEPVKPEPGVKPKAVAPIKDSQVQKQDATDSGLYAGKKAEAWQMEMRPLLAEVRRLEKQLLDLEAQIKNPVGISKSRYDGLQLEFKETQARYRQVLDKYNGLNDEANKVGLPAEFRK